MSAVNFRRRCWYWLICTGVRYSLARVQSASPSVPLWCFHSAGLYYFLSPLTDDLQSNPRWDEESVQQNREFRKHLNITDICFINLFSSGLLCIFFITTLKGSGSRLWWWQSMSLGPADDKCIFPDGSQRAKTPHLVNNLYQLCSLLLLPALFHQTTTNLFTPSGDEKEHSWSPANFTFCCGEVLTWCSVLTERAKLIFAAIQLQKVSLLDNLPKLLLTPCIQEHLHWSKLLPSDRLLG